MRRAFLKYLADQNTISPERIDVLEQAVRTAAEPIGAIAFSYGMINGPDIDEVLDEQRAAHRPFGEIAVEKGLLTQDQVDALLQVQQVRAASVIAEALILSGECPGNEIVSQLGRFLSNLHKTAGVV